MDQRRLHYLTPSVSSHAELQTTKYPWHYQRKTSQVPTTAWRIFNSRHVFLVPWKSSIPAVFLMCLESPEFQTHLSFNSWIPGRFVFKRNSSKPQQTVIYQNACTSFPAFEFLACVGTDWQHEALFRFWRRVFVESKYVDTYLQVWVSTEDASNQPQESMAVLFF